MTSEAVGGRVQRHVRPLLMILNVSLLFSLPVQASMLLSQRSEKNAANRANAAARRLH